MTINNTSQNKKLVASFLQEMNTTKDIRQTISKYVVENITWEATEPYKPLQGIDTLVKDFFQPIYDAFQQGEWQPYILMGGTYQGKEAVSVTGNYVGTFTKDWHGIPATNQPFWLRFGMIFIIENQKVIKGYCFLDMLDAIRQSGYELFKSRGTEHILQGAMTQDGLLTEMSFDEQIGKATLSHTNAMLDALSSYDGKDLASMGDLSVYWNVKNMMWYGPSGIGTTRGLDGFQQYHQKPFLDAFPVRGMNPKDNHSEYVQLGEGNYAFDFGWPLMYATHLGDDWLGLSPTGKKITLRVCDWWRMENGKLKENWVLIDMVNILKQLGVDVFDMLNEFKK